MQSVTISETGRTIHYADCWDEMPVKHLLFAFKHVPLLFTGKLTRNDFQLLIACRVLGIKLRRARGLSQIDRISRLDNLGTLASTFGFMFAEELGHTVFHYDSLTNRFPHIADILRGPADGMVDITFGEYRAAFEAYARYADTKDVAHLDTMIACLWHPRLMFNDETGRNRWRFRPHSMWHRALIARISPAKKLVILKWFEACDRNIKQGTFEINGERISFSSLFGHGEGSGVLGTAMLDLEYSLAEDGLFGGIEAVKRTNLLDILFRMLRLKERHDKRLEEINRSRS